jgi:hypothetical protein
LSDEWLLAAGICAIPFLAFGVIEALAANRRRRLNAIARRSKSKAQGGR